MKDPEYRRHRHALDLLRSINPAYPWWKRTFYRVRWWWG